MIIEEYTLAAHSKAPALMETQHFFSKCQSTYAYIFIYYRRLKMATAALNPERLLSVRLLYVKKSVLILMKKLFDATASRQGYDKKSHGKYHLHMKSHLNELLWLNYRSATQLE